MGWRSTPLQGKRWQRIRRRVFERDGNRCRECGSARQLECDHITSLFSGGEPWDMRNLQTLCRDCHIRKSRMERRKPDPQRAAWDVLIQDMMAHGVK
ncbi:MAG: HNH endonuclease signature motif containing protein [Chloroflexi bacterium]|nr:HNH endonuclease signature motif containing protein [Chloroflexota bacterium]